MTFLGLLPFEHLLQIGPFLSLGTKESARSIPPGVPLVTYYVGENFSESFLAESRIIFSIRLRAFLSQIFALSNPFFHQDIYLLTLCLLFQDYLG